MQIIIYADYDITYHKPIVKTYKWNNNELFIIQEMTIIMSLFVLLELVYFKIGSKSVVSLSEEDS